MNRNKLTDFSYNFISRIWFRDVGFNLNYFILKSSLYFHFVKYLFGSSPIQFHYNIIFCHSYNNSYGNKSIMFQNTFCLQKTFLSPFPPNELLKTIQSLAPVVNWYFSLKKNRQTNIKLLFHKVRMCKGKKLALNDSQSSNQTVQTKQKAAPRLII